MPNTNHYMFKYLTGRLSRKYCVIACMLIIYFWPQCMYMKIRRLCHQREINLFAIRFYRSCWMSCIHGPRSGGTTAVWKSCRYMGGRCFAPHSLVRYIAISRHEPQTDGGNLPRETSRKSVEYQLQALILNYTFQNFTYSSSSTLIQSRRMSEGLCPFIPPISPTLFKS